MHKRDEIIAAIKKMRGETGTRAEPSGVSAGVEDQLVSGVQTFSRDAAGGAGGGAGAGAARRRAGHKCADAGLGARGAQAGTAAQPRGILRTWDSSCGNAARAHRVEPDGAQVCAAGEGVSSGAGVGGCGENCGGEISVARAAATSNWQKPFTAKDAQPPPSSQKPDLPRAPVAQRRRKEKSTTEAQRHGEQWKSNAYH